MSHYIAMNRFRIVKGHEKDFEEIWETRTTYLENEPGFLNLTCSKDPNATTMYSTPPILYGIPRTTLKHGPNRRHLGKPIPEPATAGTSI